MSEKEEIDHEDLSPYIHPFPYVVLDVYISADVGSRGFLALPNLIPHHSWLIL